MIVLKNVDYYSVKLDSSLYKELSTIISRYNRVKTKIAQQYSSINSITKIYNARKDIRDVWTANGTLDSFNIPKRYVRNAIDDAVGNIKSAWSNTKKSIKHHIAKDKNIKDIEKHYIYYVLKSNEILQSILTYNKYDVPTKFNEITSDRIKFLNKLIRRLVRKFLPKKSTYSNIGSILIDNEMYNFRDDMFYLTGYNKSKRYEIQLKSKVYLDGSLRLKLNDGYLRIMNNIEIKAKENNNTEVIGVDKNYINVLDTSKSTSYGVGLNDLQNNYIDVLNEKNKKRQYYYELIKNTTDKRKITNIKKFNLGKKKYNRNKNRLKEEIMKKINVAVKTLIYTEKPKEIVVEDLTFTSKNKRSKNKKTKNKLSSWVKGEVQDRITYISSTQGVKITAVNAAYTSQTCDSCGHFGVRKDNMFHCLNCDKVVYSGFVAACNICDRKYDTDITLHTKPSDVLRIINERLSDTTWKSKKISMSNRANQDQSI